MRILFTYSLALLLFASGLVLGQSLSDGPSRLVTIKIDSTQIASAGLSESVNSAIVDGDTNTCGWHTDSATPGAYLQADLLFARAVVQANVFAATPGSTARYRIQYSDDSATWFNAAGFFVPAKQGWNSKSWSNVGQHRYWRLVLDNTPGPGPWLCELALYPELAPLVLRTSMFSQSGLSAYVPEGIADGDVSTPGWQTDTATVGAVLNVDLGTPRAVLQTNVYAASQPVALPSYHQYLPNYQLDASDDGLTWNWVGTPEITKAGWNLSSDREDVWIPEGGAHRYWRLYLDNTPGPGPWLTELEMVSDRSTFQEEAISESQLSQSGLTGYFPGGITDGNIATYGWQTDGLMPGPWLQVDLGKPRSIVQAGVYATNWLPSYSGAAYDIDYSDDAIQWTQAFGSIPSDTYLSVRAAGWNFAYWPNVGSHRYWRLRLAGSGWASQGPWLTELKLWRVDARELEALTPVMLSHSGLTAFDADAIVDGDNTNNGWQTDSASTGAWLAVDLGTAKPVVQANVYAAMPYSSASYAVQYSDNNITWNSVTTGFVPALQGRNSVGWPSAGAHRYWRLLLENTPGLGAWLTELELLSAR